ncbi:hypothetical protein FHX08_002426 [Rhizobium sp. BK529]|uniref:hypothetical protein n=1 Tax=unclassified Rhizobium TaxID=2613769 RepID=UPI0010D28874|nr:MULTISPECIES: hypothetical protein [unclassified Rhizobium]MBB3592082.1 hypothetical protein [Rhizobium sp. BK529]TCS06505.1 hypothetical protein EV281_102108 [Rhizobium sp. BK418]
MAMNHPSLEETDAAIARMRDRLGARNAVLARWFTDTLAAMEAKMASPLDNPGDLAQARAAAFLFVKSALHQWATRPGARGDRQGTTAEVIELLSAAHAAFG